MRTLNDALAETHANLERMRSRPYRIEAERRERLIEAVLMVARELEELNDWVESISYRLER